MREYTRDREQEEDKGSFNMADVASAAGTAGELLGEMSLIVCPHMDALASVSFSGRVDGQTGGWQGAPAATPGGATVLHKGGGGQWEKQLLTIRSFCLCSSGEEGSETHIFG